MTQYLSGGPTFKHRHAEGSRVHHVAGPHELIVCEIPGGWTGNPERLPCLSCCCLTLCHLHTSQDPSEERFQLTPCI